MVRIAPRKDLTLHLTEPRCPKGAGGGVHEGAATGRPTCLIELRRPSQAAETSSGLRAATHDAGTPRRLADLSYRGWQFFVRAKLLEPHAPHRVPQYRRPARPGHRHSLPLAIPRRPDRRARAEPAGAGRDHRRRYRGLGHRRARHHRHRSGPAAGTAGRRKLRPDRRRAVGLEFPINPERVAPVLRRLVSPTNTRARIYDRDGVLVLDSRNLYGRGDVLRFDLPPPSGKPGMLRARLHRASDRWLEPRQPAALS